MTGICVGVGVGDVDCESDLNPLGSRRGRGGGRADVDSTSGLVADTKRERAGSLDLSDRKSVV